MGTAIKHPVPDRVVIFDIWALWRSGLTRADGWPAHSVDLFTFATK